MIQRLGRSLVHGSWQRDWWAGHPTWTQLLGQPAHTAGLTQAAEALRPTSSWQPSLSPVSRARELPPADALVVLAGQQPVLAGGAALVAHKAATAVHLAKSLERLWNRPVVPVFLLATQDHDSGEVDHLDTFDPSKGSLRRHRCQITPQHEMFSRSQWDARSLASVLADVDPHSSVRWALDALADQPLQEHVARLLDTCFGPHGLRLVEAHRLADPAAPLLDKALAEGDALAARLASGAGRLRELGRVPAFDPLDPRPLVLESREGRRRRLEPGDHGARSRLSANPDDFSPHAALRPIVQAACLPVVAQVVGPSELLYLGQARGLHELFGVPAPVLVPRLEATRMPDDLDLATLGADDLELAASSEPGVPELTELLAASERFRLVLGDGNPWMHERLERFEQSLARGARRLAEAPAWRRRGTLGPTQRIHPRGRYQDTTLAWAPDALAVGRPAAWAEFVLSLCAPQQPPEHVVYSLPESLRDG